MRSRLAPLSGAVFVVLLIIAFIPVGGETPDTDASGAKVVSFYADHQGSQIAAAVLVAVAALFLAIFVGSLRDYLRAGRPQSELWPTVALVGGAVTVAGLLVAVGMHIALVDGGNNNANPDAMVALNLLDNDNFFAFAPPLVVMLLGAGGAILSNAANLPRWMGWAAVVLLIVGFTPVGFIAFALSGIWIIIASILMFQRTPATGRAS
jgi:hypothetical protein